jgi:uncharacterized protein (DUF1501 family)
MSKKFDQSRREFIKNATFISAAGSVAAPFALNLFAMNSALAASVFPDYKALVCLYLAGGNDHNNTVIATDSVSWAGYTAARGQSGSTIAIPLGTLTSDPVNTAITPTYLTKTNNVNTNDNAALSFGLHPQLKKLTARFNAVKNGTPLTGMQAAIVANVGPLVRPIHKYSDYAAALKPKNLFSHSDQTAEWLSTDPTQIIYGWGGRMADYLNNSTYQANAISNFTCISTSGNAVFLAGTNIHQYQISQNGSAIPVSGFSNLFGASVGTNGQTLKNIITPSNASNSNLPNPPISNLFELDHAAVVQRAIDAQGTISTIMTNFPAGKLPPATPVTNQVEPVTQYTNPNSGTLANNSLATQLQTVARLIAGRGAPGVSAAGTTGASRQIFFVTIGGFDTHNSQATGQADLMARIDHALDYFNTALTNLPGGPMTNNVTLFTASDFGRTLTSNGDGTDHGWGSHHFVVGGAVKGGDIYGPFRQTVVNSRSANDIDVGSGNTIPQVSVDQYAATLASWFGLNPTDINALFPNLQYFSTTSDTSTYSLGTNLGFMV